MMLGVVVPTKNEADTIGPLVKELDKIADKIVVSNAGESTDRGDEVAFSAGAEVINCRQPGLGYAYWTAWGRIPDDWYVGHIDAGGSHDPQDLVDMVDIAAWNGYDLVIGDRFGLGGEHHGTWRRRVSSQLAAWMMNLISQAHFNDWTSGLRIYSPRAREVLSQHTFTTEGHAWQIESLWVCRQAGLKICEVPIVYRPSTSHLSAKRVREAIGLWWRLARE